MTSHGEGQTFAGATRYVMDWPVSMPSAVQPNGITLPGPAVLWEGI
jgi:hypothetical protein